MEEVGKDKIPSIEDYLVLKYFEYVFEKIP
jgi:hypothetical protein